MDAADINLSNAPTNAEHNPRPPRDAEKEPSRACVPAHNNRCVRNALLLQQTRCMRASSGITSCTYTPCAAGCDFPALAQEKRLRRAPCAHFVTIVIEGRLIFAQVDFPAGFSQNKEIVRARTHKYLIYDLLGLSDNQPIATPRVAGELLDLQ
jgi:hypothetical protein